jgi:predicted component of type VI protein secretion system
MPEVYLRFLSPNDPEGSREEPAIAIRHFPCVVGRHSDCDERLELPFISRRHCALSLRGDTVWVEDLGSRNGTFLNGERLDGAQPLHDGDRLDVAFLPLRVQVQGAARAADPSALTVGAGMDDSRVFPRRPDAAKEARPYGRPANAEGSREMASRPR